MAYVNHDAKEYVRGIHHTNSIEGHWSLLKRAIKGTHVHISSKHAWKYIAEFSYRRNMRHSHWSMFNLLVHAFALPRSRKREILSVSGRSDAVYERPHRGIRGILRDRAD